MEDTGNPGNQPIPQPAVSTSTVPEPPSWWQRWRKRNVKPLPEGMPLPDILSKMLTDAGCTVNKEGVEKVAAYFLSTCLQIIEDNELYLGRVKREIKQERERW